MKANWTTVCKVSMRAKVFCLFTFFCLCFFSNALINATKLAFYFEGEDFYGQEFSTLDRNGQILPILPPRIEQQSGSFVVGSNLTLMCSSTPSFPPVYLQWFINGREVITNVEYNHDTIKRAHQLRKNCFIVLLLLLFLIQCTGQLRRRVH